MKPSPVNGLMEQFSRMMARVISPREFETWVYEHYADLERELGEDFVLELADIDYRQKYADSFVEILMYRRFPHGELEAERIKALLRQVIAWDDNLPEVLNRLQHERDIHEYKFLSVMEDWCCDHCDLEWYLSNREEVARKAEEDLRRLEGGKIRIIGRGEYEKLD